VGLAANGTYNWTLEFQCKDDDDPSKGIRFAAANFYHKKPVIDQWEFDLMMERLRTRGLGWMVETKPGLTMVDQQKCIDHDSYPALDAKPYLCGQKAAQEPKTKFICPGFLEPICDIAKSVECVASFVPLLGDCINDTECVANLKNMGLCMAEMKSKNASADETQACLVPDNKKRSNFIYCLMDDPGCVAVPVPPSKYPACQDEQIAGEKGFNVPSVFGDWYKVKGWRKGELVECLPCQQVKFWKYDPANPLPWPSPKPPCEHRGHLRDHLLLLVRGRLEGQTLAHEPDLAVGTQAPPPGLPREAVFLGHDVRHWLQGELHRGARRLRRH
jgi:hypothetical protein